MGMFRRFFCHCRSALVVLSLVILVAAGAWLWQTNQRGFSGRWADQFTSELAKLGFTAEFSSARLSFSQGLVVKELRVFSQADREELLLSADRLMLDIDRHRALRGEWEVRSLVFDNAYFRLPDEYAPHQLSELAGKVALNRDGELTLSETSGKLGQLGIAFDVRLRNFDLEAYFVEADPGEEPADYSDLIASLHREVSRWQTGNGARNELTVSVSGDLNYPKALSTTFAFHGLDLTRDSYAIDSLTVRGELNPSKVVVTELSYRDAEGVLTAEGIYDFQQQRINFSGRSGAALDRLLKDGFGVQTLDSIEMRAAPELTASGSITLRPDSSPVIRLTGVLQMRDFGYLKQDWQSLSADYSWQDGDLYLRNLKVQAESGSLEGKLLFQNEVVRYQARSGLPLRRYQPFIKKGGPLDVIVKRMEFAPDARISLDLRGAITPSDLTDWSASGKALVENFSYAGVPILSASSTFNLTQLQSVYSHPEFEFDLREDPSFKRYGGPESAVVRVDSVSVDAGTRTIAIDHLHGVCWPAPIMRMFVPVLAESIEKNYRATAPPSFSSSGIIDWDLSQKKTSLHVQFEAAAPLYYDFLGETIELRETSVRVHTHEKQVDLTNLSTYAFSGPVKGNISVLLPNVKGGASDVRGSVMWTRLRLADIGTRYGFDTVERGLLTGRLDFSTTEGKIQTLNGSGNFGLEQGELFKAPVFGPLSPLIAGIMGNKRASHETARDASANFLIRDGILHTDDFITSTDSLTVHAEGTVDLVRQTLDMTARADTEGLLKLVTLPINIGPLSGLFQFNGSGPIMDSKWENAPFTLQAKEKKDPLFAPPPKGVVIPE